MDDSLLRYSRNLIEYVWWQSGVANTLIADDSTSSESLSFFFSGGASTGAGGEDDVIEDIVTPTFFMENDAAEDNFFPTSWRVGISRGSPSAEGLTIRV